MQHCRHHGDVHIRYLAYQLVSYCATFVTVQRKRDDSQAMFVSFVAQPANPGNPKRCSQA